MSRQTLSLTNELYQYVLDLGVTEHPVLRSLREFTASHPLARMQIAPEQGQFMALLVKLLGVKTYLEVGTFTGYSALAVALAMPDEGQIYCCDIEPAHTDIAQDYWRKAGVDSMIELHMGPATDRLQQLREPGLERSIDMIFIDADKENYHHYYEHGLALLRSGGLMLVDNVLWGGSVVDARKNDPDTEAIRALNKTIAIDPRIDHALLPIADGLSLVRKR